MSKRKIPVPVIPAGHQLNGPSTLVRADGSPVLQWVKTKPMPVDRAKVLAQITRSIGRRVRPAARVRAPRTTDSDLLAVYPLGDPHIGLLTWAPETGADFDLKIVERLMVGAMADLVARGPATSDAIIANVGDFFHADNLENHTSKGEHTLDVDGRTPRVLKVGISIATTLIGTALGKHEHVTFYSVPGNHDTYTALWLVQVLRAHYRNNPRVSIPEPAGLRVYHEFGQNLIGIAHGDRQKASALVEIMAAEQAEAWGRTTHRLWLTGHVHHDHVMDFRGCRVETLRTLAARDSWHAAQGYHSARDMKRIVLHSSYGEIGRETVNVEALTREARRLL